MNGKDNLIPNSERTPEERRENARKAGIASGRARGFRSRMKKKIQDSPELVEQLLDELIQEALDGNMRAYELIVELCGESAKQAEIALKKQELKLRKEQAKKDDW